MEGLKEANVARETDVYLANPVLPDEILQGIIRMRHRNINGSYLLCSSKTLKYQLIVVAMPSFTCRGCPRYNSHSRALCWFPQTVPGVSEVPAEDPARGPGEHSSVPQGHL